MLSVSTTLALPLDAVTQTFGILAVRGAGKSNLGRVMAEEMFAAKLPFVAIDPVGSWRGLRSSGDGKAPGLPIPIFGGRWGDVPLERTSGELLADLVVSKRLSCVVDLSEFESEAAKKAFLLAFAQRLYRRNEQPLHLFLEEADDYIPQRPMRDETLLLRAWENIVRRGRARGLGITLITQRSAAVNKSVLTQVETLLVLRTTSPQDRAAVEEWVKYHGARKELLESLAGLKNGEAWCWSPHWLGKMERIQVRRCSTFDAGATPKASAKAAPPATLADVDLPALQAEWSATIERTQADDPKRLRARIVELERQLAKRPEAAPAPERVEVHVVPPVLLERVIGLRTQMDRLDEQLQELGGQLSDLRATGADLESLARTKPAPAARTFFLNEQHELPRRRKGAPIVHRDSKPSNGAGELGRGERATLLAIAQAGASGATREQLTVVTGYKRSTRDSFIQRLRAAELADVAGDRIVATSAGIDALGDDYEPLPTGAALRRWHLERLPEGEMRCLQVLIEAHPGSMHRDELGYRLSYARSSRDSYLQRLGARRLVETVGRGEVRASAELF